VHNEVAQGRINSYCRGLYLFEKEQLVLAVKLLPSLLRKYYSLLLVLELAVDIEDLWDLLYNLPLAVLILADMLGRLVSYYSLVVSLLLLLLLLVVVVDLHLQKKNDLQN
jgi:hypothetical protein